MIDEKEVQDQKPVEAEKTEEVPAEAEAPEVEIELESENPGEQVVSKEEERSTDEPAAQEKKKKRNRTTPSERIAQLTKQREQAEQYAYEQEQEKIRTVEKYEAELKKEREKSGLAQAAAVSSYEEQAKSRISNAKSELKAAFESGDAARIADAQEEMTKAAVLLDRAQQYKVDHKAPSPQPEPRRTTEPSRSAPATNPMAEKWLDKHSWIKEESEDFDQDRAIDVLNYAANLEKELHRQGKGALVGTGRYFKMLDDYIADEGNVEQEEGLGEPFTKKSSSPVAPQARTAGNGGQSEPTKQKIKLSAEEQAIALSMQLRNPDGSFKSKEEHLREYARNKQIDQQRYAERDAERNRQRGA